MVWIILLGDVPEHGSYSRGRKRQSHYRLNRHRSLHSLRDAQQALNTLLAASKFGHPELTAEPREARSSPAPADDGHQVPAGTIVRADRWRQRIEGGFTDMGSEEIAVRFETGDGASYVMIAKGPDDGGETIRAIGLDPGGLRDGGTDSPDGTGYVLSAPLAVVWVLVFAALLHRH